MEAEEAERLARELDLQRAKRDVERRQQNLGVDIETNAAPSKFREGLRVAAAVQPTGTATAAKRVDLQELRSPTPPSRPSSRRKSRVAEGPGSPFPSIREDDEPEFFSPRPERPTSKPVDHYVARPPLFPNLIDIAGPSSAEPVAPKSRKANLPESVRNMVERKGEVPPQTVLARVVRELEADFAHYRA